MLQRLNYKTLAKQGFCNSVRGEFPPSGTRRHEGAEPDRHISEAQYEVFLQRETEQKRNEKSGESQARCASFSALILWSRRDSNPGPNTCPISFLHVYSCIGSRETAGTGQTYSLPICFSFRLMHTAGISLSRYLLIRRRGRQQAAFPAAIKGV